MIKHRHNLKCEEQFVYDKFSLESFVRTSLGSSFYFAIIKYNQLFCIKIRKLQKKKKKIHHLT